MSDLRKQAKGTERAGRGSGEELPWAEWSQAAALKRWHLSWDFNDEKEPDLGQEHPRAKSRATLEIQSTGGQKKGREWEVKSEEGRGQILDAVPPECLFSSNCNQKAMEGFRHFIVMNLCFEFRAILCQPQHFPVFLKIIFGNSWVFIFKVCSF